MIVTALIFLGTFVILPAGLSFAVDGDGRSKKPKPKPIEVVPEAEPEPDPIPKPEMVIEPEPEPKMVPTTVVTIAPKCDDENSTTRLRAATFNFLSKVDNLPSDISFNVVDCTPEGMVDIEIVEVPE
tara:strand:+ start:288 stop:668 length:381 start_codon:yes stop_codon:yes gene_type:complete